MLEIDGTSLSSLALGSYRAKVEVVPQEPFIVAGTVRSNIAFGFESSLPGTVERAAELAGVLDFSDRLDLDTLVAERGVNLSGGQRQRIALARAFLREPDVLILDEATNGLDADAARRLHDTVVAGARNRITILIAHRRDTVALADKILLLANGKVVASDDRQTVERSCPEFATLFGNAE